MPKNVTLKRITTFKLEDSNGDLKTYRVGDPLVVSEAIYDQYEGFFDLIEDVPASNDAEEDSLGEDL